MTDFVHKPFAPASGDPLTVEHQAVMAWVEDSVQSEDPLYWYRDVELKSRSTGQALLDAKPDQAKRYVLAAVAQARHWDQESERVRAQAANDLLRENAHLLPGWAPVRGRGIRARDVVTALMRRALSFESGDLIAILEWCNALTNISGYAAPIGAITRALQRYAEAHPLGPELRAAIHRFAIGLRGAHDKDAKRLGTAVEQILADDASSSSPESESEPELGRPVQPAPAGNAAVLDQLKRHFGMVASAAPQIATDQIGPDRFPLRADSPLRAEHALLGEMFAEVIGRPGYNRPEVKETEAGRKIIGMDRAARGRVLLAAAERAVASLVARTNLADDQSWQSHYTAIGSVPPIESLGFEFDRDGWFDFLLFASAQLATHNAAYAPTVAKLRIQMGQGTIHSPLTDGERFVLHILRDSVISGPPLGTASDDVVWLTRQIGDGATFYLVPGESWTDALNAEIGRLPQATRERWIALMRHLLTATAARPSDRWLKMAGNLLDAIGYGEVAAALLRWLPLVPQGRTIRRLGSFYGDTRSTADVMHEENATCLRGMLWLAPTLGRADELSRTVTQVALSAYKKVPGVGPRAVKVGNAAVYALSEMASPQAVGQLAMLKVRVKFGTAQKEIEKAFNTAAVALGLPRDQIEEMGVPSYGMEEVGRRRETFAGGEFVAELRVTGRDVTLTWLRDEGKPQKSVPAKVKSEHKEELKELQGAVKDIAAMLPAQSERIDAMFLLQKSWPRAVWRERYLDHPLVGTIARRLIWMADGTPIALARDQFFDASGTHVELPESTTIAIWHPIGRPLDEIVAWRRRIEELEITQPFKQAHREVYILTDAELRTRTYSNRFAAHIIRQHQFNALCAARGWRNKLRLMVDDVYPPASKELPQFGLRAEFWIEGIGDNYGTDTNESGVYLRLSTDQVRFSRTGAAENLAHASGSGFTSRAARPGDAEINEPIPLADVPPLVFSEIMRDVDLFVGVASVGNDPTWQDGGPEGRYRDYWHGYSFGELSATAQTRKVVLERILPRLKIGDRCSFSDRFLVVRGDIRTYKIHLGSGNILMSPNDQYLCIVATQGAGEPGGVFLPFEGDNTLSIILSKAFLLAADAKIKDPTINRQILHQY
jgi:hypothetical protein